MTWKTFDGRTVDFGSISHQHLSNTVWFTKVFWGRDENPMALRVLEEKFGGELLPYRPKKDFRREIELLREMKLLVTAHTTAGEVDLIVWKGEIIGEIEI